MHPFKFDLDELSLFEMNMYTFTEDLFYGNTVAYDNKVVLNGQKNLLFAHIEETKNQEAEKIIEKQVVRKRYPTPKKIVKERPSYRYSGGGMRMGIAESMSQGFGVVNGRWNFLNERVEDPID